MIGEHLFQLFGTAFRQVDTLQEVRQFAQPNTFCLDAAGALYGLTATELTVEEVEIPLFPNLVYLNLSGNAALKQVRFERALSSLVHLDVSASGLTQLKLPAGFDQLAYLDASRNALQSAVLLGRYPRLCHLDLANNVLKEFSPHQLTHFPKLERLYLKDNTTLPSAKQEAATERGSCLAFMQRFWRELEEGQVENKEYKVILVGNGGVGKSCLVERLVHDSFEGEHKSTHGVSVQQFVDEKGDFPFILNLWDFGGQDIYHATHRLFMQANAVYLLLWDEKTQRQAISQRTEAGQKEEYPNYPLGYWLHYIQQLNEKSPTLVVKTKKEEDATPYPHPDKLYEDYGVEGFLQIDSRNEDWKLSGIRELLGRIENVIRNKLGVEKELPKKYDQVRKHLRGVAQQGRKVLLQEEYLDIAGQYNLEAPMKVLQHWLATTGVVFYRQGYFGDAIVLEQGWAIEAVYIIFDRDKGHCRQFRDTQKGCISGADLRRLWTGKNYGTAEQDLLLNFMLSCEIVFEITPESEEKYSSVPFEERMFMAPQLLPPEIPIGINSIKKLPDLLYVRYRHEFLHDGIIQSFMVRTQQLAERGEIWKNGIVLQNEGYAAIVSVLSIAEGHAKEIEVICERDNLPFLEKIRNTLEEIQGKSVTQWVSTDGENFVDLALLKDWKKEFIPTVDNQDVVPVAGMKIFLQDRKSDTFERVSPAPQLETETQILKMEREGVQSRSRYLEEEERKGIEDAIALQIRIVNKTRQRLLLEDDPKREIRLEIDLEDAQAELEKLRAKLK